MPDQAALRPAPMREVLRTRTRDAHERLHRHAAFAAFAEGRLPLEGYRRLLARLHGFYAPLDDAIARVAPDAAGPAFAPVRRADLLARDLRDLGLSDRDVASLPRCEAASDLVTPGALPGVLYVIEGATLGGATLDASARALLPGPPPAGRRYWGWCRETCGVRWKMTQALLDSPAAGAPEDVARAASATFRLFADWMAPLDDPRP
jgi:heme oxygenase